MSIELVLLIVESVLLAFTLVLLLLSLKEGRGRDSLLLEIERATKTFTRLEYFLTVTDSMTDAREDVVGLITGRYPVGEEQKRTRDITEVIARVTKAGVRVRYLLPNLTDRLHIGHIYTKAGAEVRFSGCPIFHDMRYMVVDRKATILGVPEGVGEKEATKKGYKILSEGLSTILREHFEACWEQGTSYKDYLKYIMGKTSASPKQLARELHIDEADLEKVVSGQ